MKATRISQGGQIQVPAEVRKRWGTRNVLIHDYGSYIRVAPLPDDPIAAVRGSFAGAGRSVNDIMREFREEEAEAEERKLRHMGLVR